MSDTADYRDDYSRLSWRLRRIEKGIFNTVAVLTLAALGVGLITPFLVLRLGRDISDESLSLFRSIFGLSDSGIGQLERHPVLVGIPIGLYLLVVLFALVATYAIFAELGDRQLTILRVSTTILIIGTIGAWIFMVMMGGDYKGGVRTFSPATLSFSVSAVLAVLTARLGRYVLDNDARAELRRP